jgi:hypothetical protein
VGGLRCGRGGPRRAPFPCRYNFHLDPSLTLGCGTWGSTSVSTNVGPQHLINIKTVTERRENMLWFRVPPKVRPGGQPCSRHSLPVAHAHLTC